MSGMPQIVNIYFCVSESRCRLMCMVCNRDFKSLPALNGHMRSHSGFRSPTRLKKVHYNISQLFF